MFMERALNSVKTVIAKRLAVPYYRTKLKRFQASLGRAQELQRAALFAKLRRCADSRFGRDHKFSQIKTLEDFRRQLPIAQYEYFAPYFRDVAEGKLDAMFPAWEKVLAFGCTTGTTGEPKINPVTTTWLKEYRRDWEIWGVKAIFEHSELLGNTMLQLVGPGNIWRSKSGLSIGMVSAIASKYQNPVLRSFYATPSEFGEIKDPLAKYYATLRLALVQRVGFLLAITPSNLMRLAEIGDEQRENLIRDIHNGTIRSDLEYPEWFSEKVGHKIRVKRPDRARELERIIERTGKLYPKDYWPLSVYACWIGGTIGYQSGDLPRYYGNVPARDMGLVSTEGRHTIPLEDNKPEGVLAIRGNYYEFIPEEEAGRPNPTVLEGHELQTGRTYFILMTTSSGLYRYDIGDVVRCNSFIGQAPVLEFLHKDGHCADMEGEKISGNQVSQAVNVAVKKLGLRIEYFTAVPVRETGRRPYYALLVEQSAIQNAADAKEFLTIVDRELVQQNVMYAGKRNDRYIDSPQLVRLAPGTWSAFVAQQARRTGTGESQYKHPSLVTDSAWMEKFPALDTVTVDTPVGVG